MKIYSLLKFIILSSLILFFESKTFANTRDGLSQTLANASASLRSSYAQSPYSRQKLSGDLTLALVLANYSFETAPITGAQHFIGIGIGNSLMIQRNYFTKSKTGFTMTRVRIDILGQLLEVKSWFPEGSSLQTFFSNEMIGHALHHTVFSLTVDSVSHEHPTDRTFLQFGLGVGFIL